MCPMGGDRGHSPQNNYLKLRPSKIWKISSIDLSPFNILNDLRL